jgi:hypothetical protein
MPPPRVNPPMPVWVTMPPVDVAVPDLPGGLVVVITRFDHRSQEAFELHHDLLPGVKTGRS